MNVTLIVGPPDSGKSDLAERRVLAGAAARPLYVGTLPPVMSSRRQIDRHTIRRGRAWELVEIYRDLVEAADWLRGRGHRPVLIDGVSEYIARCMHRDIAVTGFVDEPAITAHTVIRLRETADACSDLFLVTSRRPPQYGPLNAFDRIHNAMIGQIAPLCCDIVELGGTVDQNHLG